MSGVQLTKTPKVVAAKICVVADPPEGSHLVQLQISHLLPINLASTQPESALGKLPLLVLQPVQPMMDRPGAKVLSGPPVAL
jgi:hypothetical protein